MSTKTKTKKSADRLFYQISSDGTPLYEDGVRGETTCCFCADDIPALVEGKQPDGWEPYEGHFQDGNRTAEPVIEGGRCCNACSATIVIPTRVRLAEIRKARREGERAAFAHLEHNVKKLDLAVAHGARDGIFVKEQDLG